MSDEGDRSPGDEAESKWLAASIVDAAERAGIAMALSRVPATGHTGESLNVEVSSSAGDAGAFVGARAGHAALESLRKSEERFRSVVESIQDTVFMTEGTLITYANRACSKLLGISPTKEATFEVTEVLCPEGVPRFIRQVDELPASAPATHTEYRRRAAAGREI